MPANVPHGQLNAAGIIDLERTIRTAALIIAEVDRIDRQERENAR